MPDADEAAQTVDFLEAPSGQTQEAIRDLLWALLTSAEFMTVP
jgi:hypothetical protein